MHAGNPVRREHVEYFVDGFVTGVIAARNVELIQYTITGSFRRGATICGDIELILQVNDDDYGNLRHAIGEQFGWASSGNPRMSGVRGEVQFDLFIADKCTLGAMLLHTTGSWKFNKMLRTEAAARGMLLNQYGLFRRDNGSSSKTMSEVMHQYGKRGLIEGKPIVCGPNESDILTYLGFEKYSDPTSRSL